MQFGGFHVDAVHRTVTSPSGRVTRLEPKAFDLLVYFADHPEETLSRERLVADVWGGRRENGVTPSVVWVSLRKSDARRVQRCKIYVAWRSQPTGIVEQNTEAVTPFDL